MHTNRRPLLWSLAIGLIFLPLFGSSAKAFKSTNSCSSPKPGRYVVMGQGSHKGVPIARLFLEEWKADGLIKGIYFKRDGKNFQEGVYSGSWRSNSNCVVSISRLLKNENSTTWAVIDQHGQPHYSLLSVPRTVLTMTYLEQGVAPCNSDTLDGVILSQQKGLSYKAGKWLPNVVVQREIWDQGVVQGLALTSNNGAIESLNYTGNIEVEPNCTARIKEVNSQGVPFTYRAVVLSDGKGYIYLQTEGEDLTLGILERSY